MAVSSTLTGSNPIRFGVVLPTEAERFVVRSTKVLLRLTLKILSCRQSFGSLVLVPATGVQVPVNSNILTDADLSQLIQTVRSSGQTRKHEECA